MIMGILNVTPDSFSDGGKHFDRENAIAHGMRMIEEGADIIDVGGESTRPGASEITQEEEIARVIPVIKELKRRSDVIVSIDTMKAAVASQALIAGAEIINDVSALSHDPGMADVAGQSGAGVILMHMQGSPRTMQDAPRYQDVVSEVASYLKARVEHAVSKGLARETIAVDPGIGFGKTIEHNMRLLAELTALRACGNVIVVGVSRKSFVGKLTGRPVGERLAGSLAALVFSALYGADVIRVHDVKESCDAATVAMALQAEMKGR